MIALGPIMAAMILNYLVMEHLKKEESSTRILVLMTRILAIILISDWQQLRL